MATKSNRQFVRTTNPQHEQDFSQALQTALAKAAQSKNLLTGSFDHGLIKAFKKRI